MEDKLLDFKNDCVFLPKLLSDSNLLRPNDLKRLANHFPERFQKTPKWFLSYSTLKHGISLNTFYHNVQGIAPCIIVVQDTKNHIFGAYVSEKWVKDSKSYYGTGECFLFKITPHFEAFHSTKQNNYYQLSSTEFIAMGGGVKRSSYGIYLDKEFMNGSSEPCDTFDNSCLASTDHFQILVLEVWTFAKRDSIHDVPNTVKKKLRKY